MFPHCWLLWLIKSYILGNQVSCLAEINDSHSISNPDDWGTDTPQNTGILLCGDTAGNPRQFHCIQSPQEFPVIQSFICQLQWTHKIESDITNLETDKQFWLQYMHILNHNDSSTYPGITEKTDYINFTTTTTIHWCFLMDMMWRLS